MFTLFGQMVPVPIFVPAPPQNGADARAQAIGYLIGSGIGTLFFLGLLVYLYLKRDSNARELVWGFMLMFGAIFAFSAFVVFCS